MNSSPLDQTYREESRAIAPISQEAWANWRYRDEVRILVRHGTLDDGPRFLRIDYDPVRAGWEGALSNVRVELTAHALDPVTREPVSQLAQGEYEPAPTSNGTYVVEFHTPGAAGRTDAEANVEAPWLDALHLDPTSGRVAPIRLDLRFRSASAAQADPPAGQEPHRIILNVMQQRDRSNVAMLDFETGTGHEKSWFLYTNPQAKGLGMLRTIQPPYSELNTDMRLFWEYVVTAGGWVPAHPHNTEEIWYVLEGEATYIQDGEERVIRAGDAVILYPGSWHGVLADRGDIRYLCIDIGIDRENAPH